MSDHERVVSPSAKPLLAIDGMCTNYGKIRILRDVSLAVG